MASINWNPLNLPTWQVGLATAGGAVLFIVIVVLAVLGAQGAFDEKADKSSSDSGSDSGSSSSSSGSGSSSDSGSGDDDSMEYTLNKTFTVAAIDDTTNADITFPARWIQTYTQVDDLSTLPGDASTSANIKAAWKGSASIGNGNEYVILNGASVMRLRLAAINQTSGSVTSAAQSLQLSSSKNVTSALPQGYSSTFTSNTVGSVGDSLSITYS